MVPAADDARERPNALDRARVEVVRGSQVAIVRFGQVHAQRQHLRRIESLVHVVEPPRRAPDQADLHHQNQRQRDLRHDERFAQPAAARRFGAPVALAQLVHVGPRHAQRRQQRKSQRRQQRQHDADGEHAAVQAHIAEAFDARAGEPNRRRGPTRPGTSPAAPAIDEVTRLSIMNWRI